MVLARLNIAFDSLEPIDYSTIPSDPERFSYFLKNQFQHAELLINSIPPVAATAVAGGPPAHVQTKPNSARRGIETMNPGPGPNSVDRAHEPLQKHWGKPLKLSMKENPLGVAVFKGAAHDRHGAWFARRSTHKGIGFEKFKRAIQREFLESLKVQGVGAGAVRGMGADARIEKLESENLGKIEVWQLSAVFPGPVTPREFVTALFSSENALSKDSMPSSAQKVPRHLMMVSRPTTHNQLPNRKELVKGTYESVEIIREILPDSTAAQGQDPELNAVEWIMITRSDPGGGIPKFMVERGTPGTIVADVQKFLDWACRLPNEGSSEEDEKELEKHNVQARRMSLQPSGSNNGEVNGEPIEVNSFDQEDSHLQSSRDASDNGTFQQPGKQQQQQQQQQQRPMSPTAGVLYSIAHTVGETVDYYLPKGFHMPGTFHTEETPTLNHFDHPDSADEMDDEDDDSSSTVTDDSDADEGASLDHFQSAVETRTHVTEPAHLPPQMEELDVSSDQISNISTPASSMLDVSKADEHRKKTGHSQHDRELRKLSHKKAQLEERMAKERHSAEQRARELEQREERDSSKALERHDKHRKKQEAKFQKEKEKLEAKREKEERRAEEEHTKERRRAEKRQHKAHKKGVIQTISTERDQLKDKLRVSERENEVLRAQLELVQRENTALVSRMSDSDVKRALEEFEGKVRVARSPTLSAALKTHSRSPSASSVKKHSGSLGGFSNSSGNLTVSPVVTREKEKE